MSEELIPEPLPLDEQISMELVKQNYTEAKLMEFEEYLNLDIIDDDKESYLLVKERRKEVKAYRVALGKYCKFKREDAVLIQKAWVRNENLLSGRLSVVEDYLEVKEKAYEKKEADEKEARKRKQEEQLIFRQQELTSIGVLYSEGNFRLGDVSFELSAIKESDDDIWNETIYPGFFTEYQKIQAEELEKDRLRKEEEAELKRQQDELKQKQKELADKEAKLKEEEDRRALEASKRRAIMIETRTNQITALGFKFDGSGKYHFHQLTISIGDIHDFENDQWNSLITRVSTFVTKKTEEEAEEKRKEQERQELQQKRLSEITPYKAYGGAVELTKLWQFDEDAYQRILQEKTDDYNKKEEEKAKEIAEKAAKAERERIEEEQRQLDIKTKQDVRNRRKEALLVYNFVFDTLHGDLADFTDEQWVNLVTEAKASHDEIIRALEEVRKAEELLQASEKIKWQSMMEYLNNMVIHSMRGSLYRKKVAIMKEKLEEIKAL